MKKFAKIFEDEKYGQILILNDECDEGHPAVLVHFTAEGLGVCKVAFTYKHEEEDNYEKRDKAFERFTHDMAVEVVSEIVDKL